MSSEPIVQYLGFRAKEMVREYMFQVREAAELHEFTLSIANDAFRACQIGYQDAPDICSLRLHRELEASGNRPGRTHFQVTRHELDDYRGSHLLKGRAAREFERRRRTGATRD
jgi:hypothetical protein